MKTLLLLLIFQHDAFQRMFDEPRIENKKEIWRELPKAEQIAARRLNFAWGVGYFDLELNQIKYLSRVSTKLPTITTEEAEAFENESLELFTEEEGATLFGSIGPFRNECSVFVTDSLLACPCSVGSKFNMGCNNICTSSSWCTHTADGCGWSWIFPCNGLCNVL